MLYYWEASLWRCLRSLCCFFLSWRSCWENDIVSSSSVELSDVSCVSIGALRRSGNTVVLMSLAFLSLFVALSVSVCRRSSKSLRNVDLSVAGSLICIVCKKLLGTGNFGC